MSRVVKKLTVGSDDARKRWKKLDKQVRIVVEILLRMRFFYAYRCWFRFTG